MVVHILPIIFKSLMDVVQNLNLDFLKHSFDYTVYHSVQFGKRLQLVHVCSELWERERSRSGAKCTTELRIQCSRDTSHTYSCEHHESLNPADAQEQMTFCCCYCWLVVSWINDAFYYVIHLCRFSCGTQGRKNLSWWTKARKASQIQMWKSDILFNTSKWTTATHTHTHCPSELSPKHQLEQRVQFQCSRSIYHDIKCLWMCSPD